MPKLNLDTEVHTLGGAAKDLSEYAGKVLLIVNTASKCGLTPHFQGLQGLYESHQDEGLVVLGFPCNQFGKQDPGTNEEIGSFCEVNYGVTFPMHSKIDVNGDNAHPLFEQLKEGAKGLLGNRIKWNFTKFLVGRDGEILKRFAPKTEPEKLEGDIQAALATQL